MERINEIKKINEDLSIIKEAMSNIVALNSDDYKDALFILNDEYIKLVKDINAILLYNRAYESTCKMFKVGKKDPLEMLDCE